MNDTCLIIGHLNINHLLTINGLIRYYTTIYNKVYVLCKKSNYKSAYSFFSDNLNIIILITDKNTLLNNHYLLEEYKNCDILKIGEYNNNWNTLKSEYVIDNYPYLFFETYYNQLNLEYNIRYKYENINRNKIRERNFYNKIMKKYEKYIFIHDLDNKKIEIYKDLPIFHPNINYYNNNKNSKFYDFWNGDISDNILDYCSILENSDEIHIVFSSFFSLCMFLDLSKIKKKYIYTSISNIKNYHDNMNDWNIIYF
jgi:hypothetical protein